MLGGRTNHWGRISLRNGPYDFKPRSRDGLGFDWPISYEDVEPYYTKVEMLIGVYGTNEGLENTPDSPAGVLLPAAQGPGRRAAGAEAWEEAGHSDRADPPRGADHSTWTSRTFPPSCIPEMPGRRRSSAEAMANRSACFWATPCGRGCNVGANYQSTTVHLPPALATGNLDIIPDAHAREVIVDKDGKADGHRRSSTRPPAKKRRVKGKAVVLAAGAVRNRSHPAQFQEQARFPTAWPTPAGWSASTSWIPSAPISSGHIPALENLPPHNEDGAGGDHFYSPWWLYKEQKAGKLDFARGYHIEMGGSRSHARRRQPGAR